MGCSLHFLVCPFAQVMAQIHTDKAKVSEMEEKMLANIKMELQSDPEMAKLMHLEDVFQEDAKMQDHFPINKLTEAANPEELKIAYAMEKKMGWGSWSFNDPMRHSFDFKMCCEFGGLAKKMTEEVNKVSFKFLQMMGVFVLFVGVAGQFGGWSSYEMAQLIVQLLVSWQLLQMTFQAAQMKMLLGKMTSAVEHLRFISSAAGGNQVKQLMGLFDKVSYIERRLMQMTGSGRDCVRQLKQILTDDFTTKPKVIQALEMQCKSWLAARMRFKDSNQLEWEPQFQKQFNTASMSADARWEERAAKLIQSFEHDLFMSLGIRLASVRFCSIL